MDTLFKIFVGFWIGIIFNGSISHFWPEDTVTYRKGQVDALTGKVQYVLVEMPDKTKVWVKDANWNKK